MNNKSKIVLLLVFVVFSLIFSIACGSDGISFKEVYLALTKEGINRVILLQIRLPRLLEGFLVGGSLSISGVALQAIFRNPLTEPYTLGISGGAALGVAIFIATGFSFYLTTSFAGFGGALISLFIVYILALKKGILKTDSMLLIGVMVSFITSSLVLFIMALVNVRKISAIVYWLMGNLQGAGYRETFLLSTASLVSLLILIALSVNLNALSLGEQQAKALGVDVELTKKLVFITTSLLTGLSVALVGVIGFVGLVVPHFFRIMFGYDNRKLLLLSFFGGGSFLVVCDGLSRILIAPSQLPVGVITGILGGLTFIYVLTKSNKGL
ncbi:FecCD family ABC transporter permease [Hippea jasoniae]|uniref:FecCD family ABC transporter permease n=1 Tax=Hippea jasoniae TaxID=944479 RepID=UPI00068EB673|nr:iron ABC transporter permease [Hippea jasoniae]